MTKSKFFIKRQNTYTNKTTDVYGNNYSWNLLLGESYPEYQTEDEAIKAATELARRNNDEYVVEERKIVARVRPARDVEVVRE